MVRIAFVELVEGNTDIILVRSFAKLGVVIAGEGYLQGRSHVGDRESERRHLLPVDLNPCLRVATGSSEFKIGHPLSTFQRAGDTICRFHDAVVSDPGDLNTDRRPAGTSREIDLVNEDLNPRQIRSQCFDLFSQFSR